MKCSAAKYISIIKPNRSMTFDQLLEIEKNDEILSYTFKKNNIPMWGYIRFLIFQEIINNLFKLSNPHPKAKKQTISDSLKYIFLTLIKNPFFGSKQEIYIFSTGIVNIYQDGKYHNRLYNPFFQLFPDRTQILETSTKKKYLTPKQNKTVYYRDLLDIIPALIAKCLPKDKQDIETNAKIIAYLKHHLSYYLDDDFWKKIEYHLEAVSKRQSVSIFIHSLLFKMKRPKLLIIEDGYYGQYAHIFMVAKKLGIKTAEFQHGYIGLAHPAYNYHKTMMESKLSNYTPDFFLTHGDYWKDQCRVLSEKVSIGLPYLINSLKNYKNIHKIKKTLLFISGGTTPDTLSRLILDLKNNTRLDDYEFILRPHPSEATCIAERYASLQTKGVIIHHKNLYELLASVDFVIGMEVSTVLFEALYFTQKVYLMDTPYTRFYEPCSSFPSFSTPAELFDLINTDTVLQQEGSYFWEEKWDDNYRNFIHQTIGFKNDDNH